MVRNKIHEIYIKRSELV
jgi:hypothetical protein